MRYSNFACLHIVSSGRYDYARHIRIILASGKCISQRVMVDIYVFGDNLILYNAT
jgi:hypothetical protein